MELSRMVELVEQEFLAQSGVSTLRQHEPGMPYQYVSLLAPGDEISEGEFRELYAAPAAAKLLDSMQRQGLYVYSKILGKQNFDIQLDSDVITFVARGWKE